MRINEQNFSISAVRAKLNVPKEVVENSAEQKVFQNKEEFKGKSKSRYNKMEVKNRELKDKYRYDVLCLWSYD